MANSATRSDRAASRRVDTAAEPDAKLAMRVVRQIEDEVIRRGWQVGTTIGSEAGLAESLGVSRAVMREAISIAEHDGLIVSRRGRQGGLWVAAPALEAVSNTVRNYLYYASVPIEGVLAARVVLEDLMIELATPNMDQTFYADALAACEASERGFGDTLTHQMALLKRLLHLAGNPAVEVFLLSLIDLVLASLFGRGHNAAGLRDYSVRTSALRKQYIGYMYAHDLIKARQVMHELVDMSRQYLKPGEEGNRLAESYPLRVALELMMSPEELPLPVKGAETLTHRIHTEIVRRHWKLNESLGTEAELQQRYGVGRGVLREAIRPLERFGIVEMRRNVGLVIQAPDPAAIVDSVAAYLAHVGLTGDNIRRVRGVLELAGAEALAKLDDGARRDRAARLRSSLATEGGAAAFAGFYRALIESLPNQVIALFLRVLHQLDGTAPLPASPAPDWTQLAAAQARLVEGIEAGSDILARRAMQDLQKVLRA